MKVSKYNGYRVALIESEEEIEEIKENLSPAIMVGLDSETHSLTFSQGQIVGVCVSCGKSYSKEDYRGYYLPIRHSFGKNLQVDVVMEFVQFLLDNYKVVFWNRFFDNFMFEMEGVKIPFIGHTHDGQIMAHLAFSERYPKLKEFAKALLGFDVIEFSDNNAKNNDFGTTDPEVSFTYACFSNDTKFMTREGWKLYDEIEEGEEIAQWNPDTDELEFVKPLNRYAYENADTLEFKNSAISCCVTPNHRVYGRNNIRRSWRVEFAERWYRKPFQVKTKTEGYSGVSLGDFEFSESVAYGGRIHASVVHHGNNLRLDPVAFMKFIGFILGDGNVISNNGSWTVRLFQSQSRAKIEHVEWIDELNKNLGGILTKKIGSQEKGHSNKMWTWSICHKELGEWIRKNMYNDDGTKKIPECVFRASKVQRAAFLEGLRVADGSVRDDRESYHIDVCVNKALAEQVLFVVNSLGVTAKMSCYLNKAGTTTFGKNDYMCYRIHVNPHLEARSVDKSSWNIGNKRRVVCFSVPSSFLIVQRDYTTYVSGNCQDPIVTVLTARKLWSTYPYIRTIYPLDNVAGEAVRLMAKSEFYVDQEVIEIELNKANTRLAELKSEITGITGYEFRLTSNADKIDALSRFVTLTKKTKSGKFAVDSETLEDIDHPLAKLFIEYAEVQKYISSYLKKMYLWRELKRPLRVTYSACNALSGRLSSGGAEGNEYFTNFNIQNIPKEEVKGYIHRGGVCGYYVNGHQTELIPTQVQDERAVECDFEIPGYEIEMDDGTKVILPENTQLKILRDGVEICELVQNLRIDDIPV